MCALCANLPTLKNMHTAFIISTTPLLLMLLPDLMDAATWSRKYAVDCPSRCDPGSCPSVLHCKRTVQDDCGCCKVCAAARGETCYRTVSGMDGVKCGPGLRCQFYKEEDDFGDEYGLCKDCPFGTYGMDCRETCMCPSGICNRENGKCIRFPFFTLLDGNPESKHKSTPAAENEMASGDGNNDIKTDVIKEQRTTSLPGPKWLTPR
ncbi:endothelial cell-specific molecule 1 [Protopterus annectens]|uniref:endothelial cell-specific molecule 1 n=1 Tax=Protopterus annectens TaxID=7888 RepID=UPI001CFBEF0D|nr:endothelial cell-specific molecule 1 [Protopterus annectens]